MKNQNNTTKIYGLIGYPLSHSFSQQYFRSKFIKEKIENVDYLNFPIENIDKVKSILDENPMLQGFNVTIPHKEKIISFLDEIDNDAFQIKAVNTVRCFKTEKGIYLKGYNTDLYGFTQSLKPLLTGKEKNALILGDGGAAKAVLYALKQLNINIYTASIENYLPPLILKYDEIDENFIKEIDIIINATPIGMWPNVDKCPSIPYSFIRKNTIAFDLVYNPEKTMFMAQAEKYGVIVSNGLEMLKLQAEKAWEIFNREFENR
jgi:shikimate dehydrogenase